MVRTFQKGSGADRVRGHGWSVSAFQMGMCHERAPGGDRYENKDVVIEGLHRQLPGDHQRDNMALAITAFLQVAKALEITISIDSIKAGIAAASYSSH